MSMIKKDKKFYFWYFIFILFLFPVVNSFFVNVAKLVSSIGFYAKYNKVQADLFVENDKLSRKLMYYKSSQGQKSLTKARLHKVEDGEILIRFKS